MAHLSKGGLLLCTGKAPHPDKDNPFSTEDCPISVGYVTLEGTGLANPKYVCQECSRSAPDEYHDRVRARYPEFYEDGPTEEFVFQYDDFDRHVVAITVDNQIRKTFLQ